MGLKLKCKLGDTTKLALRFEKIVLKIRYEDYTKRNMRIGGRERPKTTRNLLTVRYRNAENADDGISG
jgi:hypothetical protein